MGSVLQLGEAKGPTAAAKCYVSIVLDLVLSI